MKEGRHELFDNMFFFNFMSLCLKEQCIVGHQEEFVLTGATGTPWCVLYIVPVVLTCLLEVLQLSWWSFAHLAALFSKLGLLRNVKKKCGLPLVKKGHHRFLGFLAPSWNMWCFMCCNLYIAKRKHVESSFGTPDSWMGNFREMAMACMGETTPSCFQNATLDQCCGPEIWLKSCSPPAWRGLKKPIPRKRWS